MSSLSAHLVDQYYTYHQSRMPFGQPLSASQSQSQLQLTMSGPMSYAPSMHGSLPLQQPPFIDGSMVSDAASSFSMDMSAHTAQRIASLQAKLDKKLGPEYVSTRPGPGGAGRLTYAEGWKIINLANEVFGFNGWSSSIVSLSTDFVDFSEETRRYNVGVSAVVRVTLRDGVFHEDVGYGTLENSKSKGAALDKCKKEAVTDGVKRALRNFGNLLGNCLYDKQYTSEIVKIKVPPAKFDKTALHRRPEFQEGNSGSTTLVSNNSTSASASSTNNNNNHSVHRPISAASAPVIPKAIGVIPYSNQSPGKSMNAISAHMRPNATSTPARNNIIPNGGSRQGNNANLNQAQNSRNVSSHSSGPSHQAQQSRQPLKPAPPQQQQPYSVTSVPVVQHQNQNKQMAPRTALQELEQSETYSFNSDDDEFLAALDLGELEADTGRPIGEGEGMGGAIDYEEGVRSSSGQKTLTDGASSEDRAGTVAAPRGESASRKVFTPKLCGVGPGPGPAKGRSDAPHQHQPSSQRNGAMPMQPRSLPPSNGSGGVPVGSPEDDFARQVAAMRQQRQAMRNQAAGAVTNANTNSNVGRPDENVPQKTSQGVKPRTPSMGGFNFPPGMNPSAIRTPASQTSVPVTSLAPTGKKRTVDAMSNESAFSGTGQPYAKVQARETRQPFTRLDVSADLGDAKRARR